MFFIFAIEATTLHLNVDGTIETWFLQPNLLQRDTMVELSLTLLVFNVTVDFLGTRRLFHYD